MQTIDLLSFTMLIIVMIFYFGGILILTKGKKAYAGLILPIIFTFITLYHYIKPLLVPNPHPTMKEGIYMTFFGVLAFFGFIVYGAIKHLSK
ncbi:MAG: hypothetical protein GX334_02880 [Firmicutes bacterium]|nr:hypothetical protein [Bacillota bacterium]